MELKVSKLYKYISPGHYYYGKAIFTPVKIPKHYAGHTLVLMKVVKAGGYLSINDQQEIYVKNLVRISRTVKEKIQDRCLQSFVDR